MNLFRGMRAQERYPAWTTALALLAILTVVPSLLTAAEADNTAPAVPGGSVREVTVSKTPYFTNIETVIDGKIENYNSFKLNDPFRIVVDIWGVSQGGAAPEIAVDTPQVKSVKVSQQDNKVRLVVDTPEGKPMPFLVNAEEGKLVLSVGGGEEEKVTSMKSVKEGEAPPSGPPAVLGVDLEDLPEAANVLVTTGGAVKYKVARKAGKVTLSFPGAKTRKGLLRAIEAGKLGIPVLRVLPSSSKKGVTVVVTFHKGASYKVEKRSDNVVSVSFPKAAGARAKSTVVAKLSEPPPGPDSVLQPAPPAEAAEAPAAALPKWGFASRGQESGAKYVGQRVSLDFKDADILNVFRIIAEVSNLNIITADDVKGKVTLRLINVPWDQALDLVLTSKSLGVRQDGNVLRIAPLATLRTEEKGRLDALKEVDKLKASLEGVTEIIRVNYGKASELQMKLKDLLSEGGKMQVDDRTNTIVIRDLRKNVEDIRALVQKLDSPTPQVLIEARIVEVDTSYTRELGVQWGGSWNNYGKTKVGITGIQDTSGASNAGQTLTNATPYSASSVAPNYAVNLPASTGLGSGGGISFGLLRDNLRLDLSLSAMESTNKGRVISSPKVITIDNKEATIEQGTQIPYSTVSASGTNTQFIDATLSLKVTPHITPDGGVIMKLEAKNDSQGDVGASGQPAINKKKAMTEVLVRDGETAVIGGILQITRKETQAAVPWLSKIPVLGYLFRKDTTQSTNRELLIFITPKILIQEPVQAKAS